MKKNLLAFSVVMLTMLSNAQTPRLCLYEEFTGETCPPCASTNPGLNATLGANSTKIVAIKWQVPIPSAPSNTWSLYQTNKAEIDWRYRSLANAGYGYTPAVTYAPFGKIDGQSQAVFGATGSNVDHPANLTNAIINTAQSYTSAFSVTMARGWSSTGAINLTVNIQATANFTAAGPLVFRTVMVERLIQFSVQPGTNGEKDFEDVAIRSYPTLQGGTTLTPTWTNGQTYSFTLSCMPPTYVRKKSEIAFVGFIQDDGNQKVAQVVRADKQALPDDAQAISANVPVTCSNTVAPSVDIKNLGLNAITAMTITPYIDGVMSSNLTTWTGNLAPGAATTIVMSSVGVPSVSGSHTFSYNISALNNLDVDPTNNTAKTTFMVATNFIGAPVAEGFVGTAFPPAGWAAINKDAGPGWSRVSGSGSGGYGLSNEAVKYDFYSNNNIGDKDELYLPAISAAGAASLILAFDYAYFQRTSTSNDQLDVMVSDNCGATWTSVYNNAGSGMSGGNAATTPYAPASPAEWTTVNVNISNFNTPNVLCKFVTTNDKGNNLFIDNVNLSQSAAPTGINTVMSKGLGVNVYPNPTSDVANISVSSNKISTAKITVMNTVGQVVFEKQIQLTNGTITARIDVSNFAPGIYNVSVDSENTHVVNKLTVTK